MTTIERHLQAEPLGGKAPASQSIDVSFIVAAFNAAPFIAAAIGSALAQSGVSVEAIVVDDGSSDGTAEVVADLARADARVRLVRRTSSGGPSVARNAAMASARGAWMAILDADDLIAPERSRSLLDLAAATSADMVADNFERFQVEGRATASTMIPTAAEPYSFTVDVAAFLRGNVMFGRGANLGYVKAMFRTGFMRANALRHEESIRIGEDYHLCLACLLAGARFVVTSRTFYHYRTRPGSLSWRIDKSQIDRLLQAHRTLDLQQRYAGDAEVLAAARAYEQALHRAGALTQVIDDAKSGSWARALARTASCPPLWSLAGRFGAAALAKRLAFGK